jgi:hypothetical protein
MMKLTVLEQGDVNTATWGVNFAIYPHHPDESEAIILHRDAAKELAADILAWLKETAGEARPEE